MNRTPLLSLASALGLTLNKSHSSNSTSNHHHSSSPPSSPLSVDVKEPPLTTTTTKKGSKELFLEDEIAPLTVSPPASPATRISRSSASFFPSHHQHSQSQRHHQPQHKNVNQLKDLNRIGSFGAHNLPKLRESKWFSEGEARIFCVVAEIGFIVEIRKAVPVQQGTEANNNNNQSNGSSNGGAREYKSLFGVVTRKECINQSAEDKKLHAYKLEITTIDERKKLDKLKLTDVWATNNEIRINNFNDKNKAPHEPNDILDKILFARRSKNLSWHNTEHFSYWCRYGEKPVESLQRRRQVSECIRWGSHAGVGTGMLMLFNRRKTTSK